MNNHIKLNKFTQSYLETALKTTMDNEGETLSYNYTTDEIDENHLMQVKEDCLNFQTQAGSLLTKAYQTGYTEKNAGQDFWLSRNQNMQGFISQELGEIGEQLTSKAKEYGEMAVFIGEDNQLFFTNLPFDRKQLKFKF